MEIIYTDASVSITELKTEQAEGFPVAILHHNKPAAYLVPAAASIPCWKSWTMWS